MDAANPRATQVLLVEDDLWVALDLRAQIERSGATVIGPFPSHDTAMSALRERDRRTPPSWTST